MRISDWSSDVCSSDLVAVALAQGWNGKLYDIEAIIKILTKPARLNFFLQLAVCGGDDAHVDLQRHACADRLCFAIFYDAQQLHLRIHRQFTDFVQKNCAPKIGRAHSELQSLMRISYAVFCLKKKKIHTNNHN